MIDRTVSASWVKGIAEMLEAAGLDVCGLFNDARLNWSDLNNAQARFATDRINLLWELAAVRSDNPAIGIAKPGAFKPATFDVVAYAMMSCTDLLASLQRLVCYLRIVSNVATASLLEVREGYWLTLDVFGNGQLVPRQRYEFDLMTLLTFCRWITRPDLQPLMMEFSYPAPVSIEPYQRAFRSPCHFDRPFNRMLFSHADLAPSLTTSNAILAELHDRYAGETLERLESARISDRIRKMIVRQLPDGEPLRGDIAKALFMSERTLQRRLQEEGVSFHQLVDDTRRDLAHQYLSRQNLALEQATYLLGFTDQSTFCRACKRWFDLPPGQYRSQLARESADQRLDISITL